MGTYAANEHIVQLFCHEDHRAFEPAVLVCENHRSSTIHVIRTSGK